MRQRVTRISLLKAVSRSARCHCRGLYSRVIPYLRYFAATKVLSRQASLHLFQFRL